MAFLLMDVRRMICNIPVFEKINKDMCCGCEACANICPKSIISFMSDEEGFRFPSIDPNECIKCNACVKVCPAINTNSEKEIDFKVKAGYLLDNNLVRSSSSGGYFSAFVEAFKKIYQNGKIVGVVWDMNYRYVHHIVASEESLALMRGSKYIQSRKDYVYREIKQYLIDGNAVLFTGTGCEVAALKRYLSIDYPLLYTIDIICKGSCSEKPFVEFVSGLENRYKSKITNINMRYVGWKTWIPQWIKIDFVNGKYYKKIFYTTDFGRAFYLMQRKSCATCMYSGKRRVSDITLGDFHGADKEKEYYNPNGVSIAVLNTSKGEKLIDDIDYNSVRLVDVSYDEVALANPCLRGPVGENPKREQFSHYLSSFGLREAVAKTYPLKEKIINHLPPNLARNLYIIVRRMKGKNI